jgi:hypothetical protein
VANLLGKPPHSKVNAVALNEPERTIDPHGGGAAEAVKRGRGDEAALRARELYLMDEMARNEAAFEDGKIDLFALDALVNMAVVTEMRVHLELTSEPRAVDKRTSFYHIVMCDRQTEGIYDDNRRKA